MYSYICLGIDEMNDISAITDGREVLDIFLNYEVIVLPCNSTPLESGLGLVVNVFCNLYGKKTKK
jgi:hypothetical protein